MKKSIKSSLAIVSGIIFIIILWYITAGIFNDDMIAPAPHAVMKEFFAILGEKSVYKSIIGTLWRSTISFSISFAVALALAVIASFSPLAEKFFYPLVAIVRVVPAMSVILLCLIWLRSSKSPIAVSFIVVFPMLYSAILNALKNRDKNLIQMLKAYNVKPMKVFFGATLPDVVGKLFPEFVSVFAFNIKLTISGEALAYTKQSIGREMYAANSNFLTGRLLALTVIAVLLSVALELLFKGVYYLIKKGIKEHGRKKTLQALQD